MTKTNVENRITKAMVLTAIENVVNGEEISNAVTVEDIMNYCETTLAQLSAKNEKARERAAEKKTESDALTDKIAGLMTDEFQNADEITAAVGDPEVTRNKVIARLTKLVNAGIVVKDTVKVDKSTKTVYKLASETEDVVEEQ